MAAPFIPSLQTSGKSSSRRIYVSNIPESVDEEALRKYFQIFGDLSSCMMEEGSAFGKKSGFVTFQSKEIVDLILTKYDGLLQIQGGRINVIRASSEKTQLFVGGFDLHVTKPQLEEFFSQFGEVIDVTMKYTPAGVSRCFGFVTLKDSQDAAKQLVQQRFVPCLGKTVEIKLAIQGRGRSSSKSLSSPRVPMKKDDGSYGPASMRMKRTSSARFQRPSESEDSLDPDLTSSISSLNLSRSELNFTISRDQVDPISEPSTMTRRWSGSRLRSSSSGLLSPRSPRVIDSPKSISRQSSFANNENENTTSQPAEKTKAYTVGYTIPSKFAPKNEKSTRKPENTDEVIEGTSMYSRKYFAPVRKGF